MNFDIAFRQFLKYKGCDANKSKLGDTAMSLSHPILRVPAQYSIFEIEKLLDKLKDSSVETDLLLPTNLNGIFGADVALIQGLMTWSRACPKGNLIIYPNSKSLTLVDTDPGLVGVLSANEILEQNISNSKFKDALKEATNRLLKMERATSSDLGPATKGPKIFLLCADDTFRGELPLFYHSARNIRGLADFRDIVQSALEKVAEFDSTSKKLTNEIKNHVATLVFELFANTSEWGRLNVDGSEIRKSLRGIRFEYFRDGDKVMQERTKNMSALRTYFENLSSAGKYNRFVEISVFDSGPGHARRWLNREFKDFNIREEFAAVAKCFLKHSSSSNNAIKGLGLARVMTALTEVKGFIAFRSGRLFLQRDLVRDPVSDTDYQLRDWENGGDPIERAPAVGAVVTVLIPIPASIGS